MTTRASKQKEVDLYPVAAPYTEKLPFTLEEIKAVIPKHCWKASMFWSWYYIIRDICQFALAAFICYHALEAVGPDATVLRAAIWLTHAFVQGTTSFGLWVIGHECGHQAYFGSNKWLNELVGFIIHTFYFVPYHAWRVTHGTHHRYTNHLHKDTVFIPKEAPGWNWWAAKKSGNWAHYFVIGGYLTLGWLLYITLYWEGQVYESGYWSHFNPSSPMFTPKDRLPMIIGNIGFGAWALALITIAMKTSWSAVFLWYGLPLMVNNAWLVVITFLQHTDSRLPHYDDNDGFEFVKGALCTVDRDYGIFNNWMHHITDAHVVHHMFSYMPFYHAKEATPYVAKLVGKYRVTDSRPLYQQFWDAWMTHQSSFLRSDKWKNRTE